jgi:DNA-binding transcriptional LysR family regulator
MELRHLRYFVTVAEELNYRKAAERLHVSAPSLSTQIRDLESELGVRLFDRNSGGVRLSDAGAAFLPEARLTLAQSQHAGLVAREAAEGLRGQLTVAYVEPVLMGFMPAILMVFHRRFPDVDITLAEMQLQNQIMALESGTIQVGFSLREDLRLPRGYRQMLIAHSPVRAIMHRNHRLASSSQVTLAELARDQLLCHSINHESPSLHGELMRLAFAARGLKIGRIRPIEGSGAFRAMLEAGLGVSLIPEIGGLAQSRVLVLRPLADTGLDLSVKLLALWRDAPASRATVNFVAVMRETASGRNLEEKRS